MNDWIHGEHKGQFCHINDSPCEKLSEKASFVIRFYDFTCTILLKLENQKSAPQFRLKSSEAIRNCGQQYKDTENTIWI